MVASVFVSSDCVLSFSSELASVTSSFVTVTLWTSIFMFALLCGFFLGDNKEGEELVRRIRAGDKGGICR